MNRAILIGLLVVAIRAGAAPVGQGDVIEPFSLEDQHGTAHRVDGSVAIILFSRDMAGGDVLKEALKDAPPEALSNVHAVYVADISGMPRLVARLFAIPSMRRRPYSMLLDRDGSKTAVFPDLEGQATLIFLDALKVTHVLHLATPSDVRQELNLDAGARKQRRPTERGADK
jgi:hypothetical protein